LLDQNSEDVDREIFSDDESSSSSGGEDASLNMEPMSETASETASAGVDTKLPHIIQHIIDKMDAQESRREAYQQGNTLIFSNLCDIIGDDYSHIDLNKRAAKSTVWDILINAVSLNRLASA